MTLRILEPGLCTLLVDLGRPRTRSLGVPLGGAADRTSLALGNALVGNPPDAAALEIALAGPTLQALTDVAGVVYGASFDVRIGEKTLRAGATFTLRANEVLRIGGAEHGARAYFCVRGGFQTLPILGSRSGLVSLPRGAELICPANTIASRFLAMSAGLFSPLPRTRGRGVGGEGVGLAKPNSPSPPTPLSRSTGGEGRPIRVLPGAQADWFPANGFHGRPFTVTPQSNRMGLRLDGPLLPLPQRELVSEPVCPGAVQVTRDGQCIILGVDGQTIGGYPKIAQVISADLDRLGQLRPGDAMVFHAVTLEEAEAIHHRQHAELQRWLTRIRAAEIF